MLKTLNVLPTRQSTPLDRTATLSAIRDRVASSRLSLSDAIRERELYFRVSVVAGCNLSCPFCHNEGAPTTGLLDLAFARSAIEAAVAVGFRRVQFTGGEPLLRKDIGDFVLMAREFVDDVGVTTNGSFLRERIDSLVESGIRRIHVSLQTESLIEAGDERHWGVPEWLIPTLELARKGVFSLRLNLPVPQDCLSTAEEFLPQLLKINCDAKVFSILPEGKTAHEPFSYSDLEQMVERVNRLSSGAGWDGRVMLRGYRSPTGIRCGTCADFDRCKEQSHSLRLGADKVLRPCLATRNWDSKCSNINMIEDIREAAYLALDYYWAESSYRN